jgi:hypothetical protein
VRSAQLARIVAPGARNAYDVIASVGIERFMEHRQYQEIAVELSRRLGIDVPQRTVSHLGQKFVAYFAIVHQESTPLLRKDMRDRGGYILVDRHPRPNYPPPWLLGQARERLLELGSGV